MSDHDLPWIRGALQTAIAIEYSTMPIYSTAMYSLEVQNYPAYNVIRSVLMEEMLHMSAAANMVAALGAKPRIKALDASGLSKGLPGGVAPGLRARCAKLSRSQLDTFMRIEAPESIVTPGEGQPPAKYPTIGAFYEEIKQAVIDNADGVVAAANGPMRANQVGGNLGYACIDPLASQDIVEQFVSSIELIQDQGEGSDSTRTTGPESDDELSHYARFAELRFGRRYTGPGDGDDADPQLAESQRRYYQGEVIAWPNVINMLAVPDDGYLALLAHDRNREDIETALEDFDAGCTRMVQALDDCWNGPVETAWPSLGRAVYEMNELRVTSCFRILRQEVPPAALARLEELYPLEAADLAELTDLGQPVFYGPRFRNALATS